MADDYTFSKRDAERIQRVVRAYERSGGLPVQPRRVVGGGDGGGSIQYAIVTQIPVYNDPTKNKFVVQKASKNNDDEWEGDGTDIDIERALGFEGFIEHEGNDTAKDIRNWSPWPPVGSVIEITERWDAEQSTPADRWYMIGDNTPCIYGGSESDASLRVDDETLLTQAVWA